MKNKSLLIFIFLLIAIGFVPNKTLAQTGEIRGTVKDRNGDPVVGARVTVVSKNGDATKRGGITNSQGLFIVRSIPAGESDVTASAIGYKELKKIVIVPAGASADADFSLAASVSRTEEVVVTGQGNGTERRKLAVTVESLSAKQLENASGRTFDQLIQGRVPGLTAFTPTGMPGSGARVATRGIKSLSGATTPVIYIDGVRVDGGDNFRLAASTGGVTTSALNDLLTGDIERVEFLKGGASSTLYGSEAANGVIQIFTKKGIPGAPKYAFTVMGGFDSPETKFIALDLTKQIATQISKFQQYNVNISGGTDNLSYNVSGKMTYNTGVSPKDQAYEKVYAINGGLRAKAGEHGSLEFSMSYVNNSFGRPSNNNSGGGLYQLVDNELGSTDSPSNPRWRWDGSYGGGNIADPTLRAAQRKRSIDSLVDLYTAAQNSETVHRFINSLTYKYEILPGWNNRLTLGVDYRKSEARLFTPISVFDNGSITRADRENLVASFDFLTSYILPEVAGLLKHNIAAGAQGYRREERPSTLSGTNFALPGTSIVPNTATHDANEAPWSIFTGGFLANYKLELLDRIFIDIGARYDLNSTFGDKVNGAFFPKAAIAYLLSEESFYPESLKEYLTSVKFRASFGATGNFPAPFTRDRSYLSVPFQDAVGLSFGIPGNQDLTVERVESVEVGVDLSLFQDKASLTFDYFRSQTLGALFPVAPDPTSGFVNNQLRNVGALWNEGIEVSLRALVIDIPEVFDLNLTASMSSLSNKLLSLGGSPPFNIGGFAYAPIRVERVGFPYPNLRASFPIKDADGSYNSGQILRDSLITKSVVPTLTANMGLDMTILKNLTLSVTAEFATGHLIANHMWGRQYPNVFAVPAVYRPLVNGTVAYPFFQNIVDEPRIPKWTTTARNGELRYTRNDIGGLFIEDGTWFKIREISLRYKFPNEIIKGLAFTASVRNPFIWTAQPFVDPELSFVNEVNVAVGGIAGTNVSPPRMFRFSLAYTLQ